MANGDGTIRVDTNIVGDDQSTPGTINIDTEPVAPPAPLSVSPRNIPSQGDRSIPAEPKPAIVSPTRTVPIFAPDGSLGDIPAERVHDAIAAGGAIASPIIAPDGSHGSVPANRLHEALKAGAKIDDTGWTPGPGVVGRLAAMTAAPGAAPRQIELSKMNPLEAAKEIGQAGTPHPESVMTPYERSQHPYLTAGGEFVGSMASPENFAIMIGSGGLGRLPGPAGNLIAKALSTGFGINMIFNAVQESPKFLDALARGDEPTAKYELMKTVLSAAVAEQAGEHATGVKPTLGLVEPAIKQAVGRGAEVVSGAAGSAVGKAAELPGKVKEMAVGKPATAPELVGKITQATGEDITTAGKALKSIDTTGVKTFSDLSKTLDTKIRENTAAVDSALSKDTKAYKPVDLEKRVPVEGGRDVVSSPVTEALNQLRDYYEKTNDTEGIAKIQGLQAKQEGGLTVKEINDVARLHGNVLNAYNAAGELASGLSRKAAENTRMDVKDIVRKLTPDEETKALDKNTSDLITTRDLSDKMDEKVQKLQNKLEQAGLWRKALSAAGSATDIISGGFFKALLGMGESGDKVLNAVDVQKNLPKNLELLDKLNAMDPASAMKEIQKISGKEPDAVNPTPATAAPAPGSELNLESRSYEVPTESAMEVPVDKRNPGEFSRDTHIAEWGHVTNGALEGFKTKGIRSHLHPELKGTSAQASAGFKTDINFKDPEDVQRNFGKILSTALGHAAAQELHSDIPFEMNRSTGRDIAKAKQIGKLIGLSDDEMDGAIRYGLDRAKRNLTQPGISDKLLENVDKRESGLDQTMHASPERTEAYADEIRRIQDENRSKQGDVRGNVKPDAGRTREASEAMDAGTEGKASEGNPGRDLESRAEVSPQKMVEDQGLVYKGKIEGPTPETGVHQFESKDAPGVTMALRQDKMTPEAIKAKAAAKPAEGAIVPKLGPEKSTFPGHDRSSGFIYPNGEDQWGYSHAEIIGKDKGEETSVNNHMSATGAVRINIGPNEINVNAGEPLTEQQLSKIANLSKRFDLPKIQYELSGVEGTANSIGEFKRAYDQTQSIDRAAESVKKGEGFAADLRSGKPTDAGFLVEVMPESRRILDHDVTPKDIQKFYNDNRELFKANPELRVGGYKNELNISAHTEDQAAATTLAKKLDQRSVWDVKNGKEVPTGGQGRVTHFSYPFESRMKDLRHGG